MSRVRKPSLAFQTGSPNESTPQVNTANGGRVCNLHCRRGNVRSTLANRQVLILSPRVDSRFSYRFQEAPQLAGQLNIILQREDVLLKDLRHLRAEIKVTEANLKRQLEEERSARTEVEKRNTTLTHRNERLHSDLQKLTSDHQAALERENLVSLSYRGFLFVLTPSIASENPYSGRPIPSRCSLTERRSRCPHPCHPEL